MILINWLLVLLCVFTCFELELDIVHVPVVQVVVRVSVLHIRTR